MSSDDHKARAIDVHDAQAEEFDTRYEEMARDPYSSTFTYGRRKIELLIDRELDRLPSGLRAIDVGCGTGFNLARLRRRGYEVVGVEPAEGMRLRAREHNPGVAVEDGDIEHLPFPDGSFDLALSIEVIRYLAEPTRGLAEIARILKPGGTAIVTAAPLWSLNGYALINAVTARVSVPTFTRVRHSFHTEASARRAARDAGFASVAIHGVFLGPWQALGRLSPRALGYALRACEPIEERLADRWPWRNLTNHLVLVARR